MRLKRVLAVLVVFTLTVSAATTLGAQTELDRVVSRVNDKIITQSDIRDAMLLKLVDDTSSAASTQRGLEDRLLILSEISRLPALSPGAEGDVAAKRSAWEASVGGRGRVTELVGRTSFSEAGLDTWLRDDLRIQAHLNARFGNQPDRAKAQAEWVARLRQRAGLK